MLGQDLVVKVEEKWKLSKKILKQPNLDKRAIFTRGENPWNSMLVIMSTFGFHQPRVCNDLE
jgi:hypothetical protein